MHQMCFVLRLILLLCRLLTLMKEAESSITLEDIKAKHKVPSTHAYSSKGVVDRTITLGKIEGSVEVFHNSK